MPEGYAKNEGFIAVKFNKVNERKQRNDVNATSRRWSKCSKTPCLSFTRWIVVHAVDGKDGQRDVEIGVLKVERSAASLQFTAEIEIGSSIA